MQSLRDQRFALLFRLIKLDVAEWTAVVGLSCPKCIILERTKTKFSSVCVFMCSSRGHQCKFLQGAVKFIVLVLYE